MAGTVELDIAGLEGNMMAQPRVFAHDAKGFDPTDYDELLLPVPTADETVFMQRGACLYVGVDVTTMTVTMESGNEATFLNIPAGSFLPILVIKIQEALTAPATDVVSGDIVVLW